MAAFLNFRVRDFSDEYSTIRLSINDLDGVNYVDDVTGGGTGARSDLQAAILGVIIGNMSGVTVTALDETINDERPASGFAQVETGLRMYGRTAAGKLYFVTIPTPDLAAIAVAGTDDVNLAAAPVAALVTALEAHWLPAGEAVTIERGVIIGRAR